MTPRRPRAGPWAVSRMEDGPDAPPSPPDFAPRRDNRTEKAPLAGAEKTISWDEAAVLNQRNIVLAAAWLLDEKDIKRIFGLDRSHFDTQQRFEKEVGTWKSKMNRDIVRITMSLLCQDWLERHFAPPGVPINKLKEYLIAHGSSDAKYKRLERALKTLRRAGFIEGFDERSVHTTKSHEIRATKKGVDEHLIYLARCRAEAKAFEDELMMVRLAEDIKKHDATGKRDTGDR